MALSLILSISLTGLLSVTSTEANLTRDLNQSTRALYISEAGISLAEGHLWSLISNPPANTSTFYPFGSNPVTPTGTSCSYQISVIPDADNSSKEMKGYTIQSVGTADGRQRTVETTVSMESFAKYAYYSNNEYNSRYRFSIWFTSNDV